MNEIENLKLRAGKAKAPIGIVPMHALFGVARVLEDSGCHYAPGNFMVQSVADAVESYDSAQLRHRIKCTPLSGLVTPETYAALDDDTGLPHIDHMIAGLLILRTLMIRDGMLSEDPGQGKRKRAADAAKISKAGDPGYRTGGQPRPDPRYAAPEVLADFAAREAMQVETSKHMTTQPGDDPDAARRAATEANLRKLEAEQRAATIAKEAHENRFNGKANTTGVQL